MHVSFTVPELTKVRELKYLDILEYHVVGRLDLFELEDIMTGWCKNDSGVKRCPLSPLLFNIYVRELGMNVARCKHGLRYLMADRDGLMVEKSQAGFLYADDVCLIASNEQDLQRIFDSISGCISEYGMKVG